LDRDHALGLDKNTAFFSEATARWAAMRTFRSRLPRWSGSLTPFDQTNFNLPGWTHYSFSGLVASSNSTLLTFASRNIPDYNGFDNIPVTAAVPEPETYAMLLAGLALIGAAVKRRKASQV
jgi:hypothetical protein